MTRFWDGQTDGQMDGQTDRVTALLDLLSPLATQVITHLLIVVNYDVINLLPLLNSGCMVYIVIFCIFFASCLLIGE